jgi:hypothetical protein
LFILLETYTACKRERISSSFRDPAGFVIRENDLYKRVVTQYGLADFLAYLNSGLHRDLVAEGLVLDFTEEPTPADELGWERLIVPEQISFISYPYEWTFHQLKDAALLTLKIQELALARGLSLKDASPFNIQFRGSVPVLIDTLSFEQNPGRPWIAYEQFCREFLGPLLLMSYGHESANSAFLADLAGQSLESVSNRLPRRSYFNLGATLHVHMHARAARKRNGAGPKAVASSMTAKAQLDLVTSLRNLIENLKPATARSAWTDYYSEARFYSQSAVDSKRVSVRELAGMVSPRSVCDLGTNTGLFATELSAAGVQCIATDADAACIDKLYLQMRAKRNNRVLPLRVDLANPSPALGFGLAQTASFFDRVNVDLVLCLGLIHHLRFTNNVPLFRIAETLARCGRNLLVEFVPMEDPSAQVLVNGRRGFDDYTPKNFLSEFGVHYREVASRKVSDSPRSLHLLERKS